MPSAVVFISTLWARDLQREAKGHAEERGLALVGYYQAAEYISEHALSPVGERVAMKVRESFADVIALVVSSPHAYTSATPTSLPSRWGSHVKWKHVADDPAADRRVGHGC